jgi:hypothetical protein
VKTISLRKVLLGAGSLAIIAFVVFVFTNQKPEPSFITPAPSDPQKKATAPIVDDSAHQLLETVSSERAETTGHPANVRPRLSEVVVRSFDVRYTGLREEKAHYDLIIATHLQSDPESAEVVRAELHTLTKPLLPITVAQGMEDPVLRPMLQNMFAENSLLSEGLEKRASELNLDVKFTQARDLATIGVLLRSSEPAFQAEYARLVTKFQINEKLAQAFARSFGNQILMQYMEGYLGRNGYPYSPDRKRFDPRPEQ